MAAAFALPPDFAGWVARVVGAPGWTCLLALDDDVPVGAAALVVAGDAAWFGLGATLAEHRGKGAQGALFAARSPRRARRRRPPLRDRDRRARGRRRAAGPPTATCSAAGFREAELRPNYASPAG